MRVERVSEPGEEWDRFVTRTEGATLGHAAAWHGILREAYGLEPCYLAARDSGALRGVLPMMSFRRLFGGRELVSLPYLDTAGILAADDDAEAALLAAAREEARACGATAIELRQARPLAGMTAPAMDRVNLVLPLAEDAEAQWRAIPGKARNQTRKAEREGLSLADGAESGVDDFYGPFRVNMRDLGSPVHARGFYRAMQRGFGERLRFVVVRDGARPVGGLVAIHFADVVTVPWASTLRSERRRCPNNLIYWEAIRWAVERGAVRFDFGRSPVGGGTHRFKKGWGARDEPLAWTRFDPDGRSEAVRGAGDSATLQHLSQLWTRLPVPLTAWVGPRLRRRISS